MATRPGGITRITYDTDRPVEPGDLVVTESGRRYLVDGARLVANRGGKRPEWSPLRWRLTVVVLGSDDPDPDGERHELVWNSRDAI